MMLNQDQAKAAADIVNRSRDGVCELVLGKAGTGKTYLLEDIYNRYIEKGWKVRKAAKYGLTAQQIDGCTLSRLLCTGICNNSVSLGQLINETPGLVAKAREQLEGVHMLIVDEISAISFDYLHLMDLWLRLCRETVEPFGGIRVLFFGDFLQLPPVIPNKWEVKWPFYSTLFPSNPILLAAPMRQSKAEDLQILDDVRWGHITDRVRDFFGRATQKTFPPPIEPTKLFSHNRKVSEENDARLNNIPFPAKHYHASFEGFDRFPKKDVPIEETLALKESAKVIIVSNNQNEGYVNGSQGRIIQMEDNKAYVELDVDARVVEVECYEWTIRDGFGRAKGKVVGLPIKLAWAISIHKSQGMTLDNVEADLSQTFAPGMSYTALSRTRDLDNVRLPTYPRSIQVDADAVKYMRRLQNDNAN